MATTAPSPRHRARRALAPLLEIPPIVEVHPPGWFERLPRWGYVSANACDFNSPVVEPCYLGAKRLHAG